MLGIFGHNNKMSQYDKHTKFGQTFRNFMVWAHEALQSQYPGTGRLSDIRRFSVPVKGSSMFVVEILPTRPPFYRVEFGGKVVRTDMFDDVLEPVLTALGHAGLDDSHPKFTNSVLKQATPAEHELSHNLNSNP